jgi:hypothetical protein
MLFGLSNTLVIFQVYINHVLVSLINITCIIYLNIILIYSKDLDFALVSVEVA